MYEAGAFLANYMHLKPGREQAALDNFEADEKKLLHIMFRGNGVLFDTHVYAPETAEQLKDEVGRLRIRGRRKPGTAKTSKTSSEVTETVRNTGRIPAFIRLPEGEKELLMEMCLLTVYGETVCDLLCETCKMKRVTDNTGSSSRCQPRMEGQTPTGGYEPCSAERGGGCGRRGHRRKWGSCKRSLHETPLLDHELFPGTSRSRSNMRRSRISFRHTGTGLFSCRGITQSSTPLDDTGDT